MTQNERIAKYVVYTLGGPWEPDIGDRVTPDAPGYTDLHAVPCTIVGKNAFNGVRPKMETIWHVLPDDPGKYKCNHAAFSPRTDKYWLFTTSELVPMPPEDE